MRGASNPARWGTVHSVLPLHCEECRMPPIRAVFAGPRCAGEERRDDGRAAPPGRTRQMGIAALATWVSASLLALAACGPPRANPSAPARPPPSAPRVWEYHVRA